MTTLKVKLVDTNLQKKGFVRNEKSDHLRIQIMIIEPYFHVKGDTYCYSDSNVLRNLLGIIEQHYALVKHAVVVKEVAKTFEKLEEAPKEYEDSQMPKGFDSVRVAPQEGPKVVRDSKNLNETH